MNGHIWLTYMPQFILPFKRDLILLEKMHKKISKWDRWFLVNSSPFEFEHIYKIQNLQLLGSYYECPYSRTVTISHFRFKMHPICFLLRTTFRIGVPVLVFINVLSKILQFVRPLAAQIHKWLFKVTIYCMWPKVPQIISI